MKTTARKRRCESGRKEKPSESRGKEKEEIQEERITEIESEGSSTMPNSPVTGTVWKGNRSVGSSGADRKPLGEKKVDGESGMKLGFAPYSDWAYDEVLNENTGYVKFTIEEGVT